MHSGVLDSRLTIIGPGRAASALGRSWIRAGGRLNEVLARAAESADEAVRRIGGGTAGVVGSGAIDCDLLVLGVPDDAIGAAALAIAPRVACRAAFHLSGARPARELEPLGASGASLGSLHPVRAFSGDAGEVWEGCFVAVEGDSQAVAVGERIARALGAHGHRIEAEVKPRYHAAATLAAAGTLAAVSLATRLWSDLGIPEEDGRPALSDLSAGAAAAARTRSFQDAFTGPIARRDVGTVRAHAAALREYPDALAAYRAMARETLRRTSGRGKEDEIWAAIEANGP